MNEFPEPLSSEAERFLEITTRRFGNRTPFLSGVIEKIQERQTKLKEIEKLPEPERSFRLMGFYQAHFTTSYENAHIRKTPNEEILAVIQDSTTTSGYMLGYQADSLHGDDALNRQNYMDTFYRANVEGFTISKLPTKFEAETDRVVVKLFEEDLTEKEKVFLIENTGRN